jgi:energy-converting hydrogenase Eha subunit A
MIRPFFIHLLSMLLGYAFAVLTATTVVCLVRGLPTVFPDQGQWGSFYRYLNDLPAIFSVGLMMTAAFGLPGWLISVVLAEVRDERRKFWFALAGVLTALLAHLFAGGTYNSSFDGIFMIASILAGGLFGGLAYWALTGRRSGSWKSVASQPLAEARA